MTQDELAGFWCYTREDDSHDGGRIVDLSFELCREFRMISGKMLTIFVDREDICWGEQWRARIGEALDTTTFFFPVVTPLFFESVECRRELLQFSGQARSLGISDLIMPLIYVGVSDLSTSSDNAKTLVSEMQFVDIQDLRFMDAGSPAYRRRINELAKCLVDVARKLSEAPQRTASEVASAEVNCGPQEDGETHDDDEGGLIDLIARFEEDLPLWQQTIEEFPGIMEEISTSVQAATEKVRRGDEEGRPFAYRIVVARELASQLSDPARRMVELSERYVSQLVAVDPGVRALIRAASEGNRSPEELDAACELFRAVRVLVSESLNAASSLKDLADTLAGNARMSRDLRPVLREIRSGLQGAMDGKSIIQEWERQINATGIDCESSPTSA